MATFFQRPDSLPVGTFNEDPRGPTKTKTTMNELREDGLPTWMNCIDTTGKPISYCRRLMVETKQMFNKEGRKMQDEEGIIFSVCMVEKVSTSIETDAGGSSSDSDVSQGDVSSSMAMTIATSRNSPEEVLPTTVAEMETDVSTWDVLFKTEYFVEDSSMGRDLRKYRIQGVLLEMTVPDNYPMEPPFVRVKYPELETGYVFPHGAICFEPLTPKGWPQTMTLMAVAISLKAMFNNNVGVKSVGDVRTGKIDAYSREGAMRDFKKILAVHKGGDKWHRDKKKLKS